MLAEFIHINYTNCHRSLNAIR